MPDALDALAYAEAGFAIFPIRAPRGGACTCGKECGVAGKHPHVRAWQDRATSDTGRIIEWWSRWPDANLGFATGPSGLVVIDADGTRGLEAIETLKRDLKIPMDGPQVVTPGGGRHWYFRAPRHTSFKTCARGEVAQKVDVRATGGMVVAPPSVHKSGGSYRWMDDDAPVSVGAIPTLPHALYKHLYATAWKPEQASLPMPKTTVARREAPAPAGPARTGSRNQTLTSYAGTMRRRGMSEAAIEAALLVENQRNVPPLGDAEVRRIAKSIGRYAPGA